MSNKYDSILGEYRQNDATGLVAIGSPFAINEIPYVGATGTLNTVGDGTGTTDYFKYNPSTANVEKLGTGVRTGYQASSWNGDSEFPNYFGTTVYHSNGIDIWSGTNPWEIWKDGALVGSIGGISPNTFNLTGDAAGDLFLFNIENVSGDVWARVASSVSNGLFGIRDHTPAFQHENGYSFRIEQWGGALGTLDVANLNVDAATALAISGTFGNGSFDVFSYGNDGNGLYSNLPFRCYWNDDLGYLTFDDGAGYLTNIRANVYADYLSATASIIGDITGTQLILTSNDKSKVPAIISASSATNPLFCSFTYRAAATFTVTTGSPGKLNVTNTFVANECVKLTTTGTLPTEINTTTVYYVRNPSGSQIELSTTSGGASINIVSGAGTGTHTVTMLCKVTATSHGRSTRDPVIFGGGTPLPTGLTAGTHYYVSDKGLTSGEFYICGATNLSVGNHIVINSAGSGAPFCYGSIVDLARWNASNGSTMAYLDKYGSLYGNLLTTPWRIGIIPADSNYSGIWFSSAAASPSSSNYSFLGDPTNTFINGPTNLFLRVGNVTQFYINSGYLNFAENVNFVLGTTTGTRFGNAANQKLAFWGATAIVQPTTAFASATFVANAGTAVNDASTFDGYTIKQVVAALRAMGKLA